MFQLGDFTCAFGDGHGLAQRRLVELELELPSLALDGEIDGAIAPVELLLTERPRFDFKAFKTRRQP